MMAHKRVNIMQYSEIAYYDDEGNEVARDRQHDDHTYDTGPEQELTEQEREDWL